MRAAAARRISWGKVTTAGVSTGPVSVLDSMVEWAIEPGPAGETTGGMAT